MQSALTDFNTGHRSYYGLGVSHKSAQARRVWRLCQRVTVNRREIRQTLEIGMGSVCARVSELRDEGLLVVSRCDVDPVTGIRVQYLEARI